MSTKPRPTIYKVSVTFRVFDHIHAPFQFDMEEVGCARAHRNSWEPVYILYPIRQRVREFIQRATDQEGKVIVSRKRNAELETLSFMEISIDNGTRMTVYKYKYARTTEAIQTRRPGQISWNSWPGKTRYRNRATGEQFIRTKQTL